MNTPLVTVSISTYNRSSLLSGAIEAVLAQSYPNFELIIVNDHSPDNTDNVVEEYLNNDSRVKYIKHSSNKGLASARNTAIESASGKYFTFIDDDDLWDRDFLTEFVKLAEEYNDEYCFCCGNESSKHCFIPKLDGNLSEYIKKGYTPPVAAQFYYLSSLKKINGYNSEIKTGVDHDLWLRLACNDYKIKSLEKCLAISSTQTDTSRMTTNPKKRISLINNSFKEWEEMIVSKFGRDFFEFFKKGYFYNIYRKFFLLSLRNRKIFSAGKYFLLNPMKFYLVRSLFFSGFTRGTHCLVKLRMTKGKENIVIVRPSFPPYRK